MTTEQAIYLYNRENWHVIEPQTRARMIGGYAAALSNPIFWAIDFITAPRRLRTCRDALHAEIHKNDQLEDRVYSLETTLEQDVGPSYVMLNPGQSIQVTGRRMDDERLIFLKASVPSFHLGFQMKPAESDDIRKHVALEVSETASKRIARDIQKDLQVILFKMIVNGKEAE